MLYLPFFLTILSEKNYGLLSGLTMTLSVCIRCIDKIIYDPVFLAILLSTGWTFDIMRMH